MVWCVKPYDAANHEPTAVCNGDRTLRVLKIETAPGNQVELNAAGSSDRDDGDRHRGEFHGSLPFSASHRWNVSETHDTTLSARFGYRKWFEGLGAGTGVARQYTMALRLARKTDANA